MTRTALILLALPFAAAPAAAQQSPDPPSVSTAAAPSGFDLARAQVNNCAGEKFEFESPSALKVTLCSDKDSTKDEVVRLLNDAASRLEQNLRIPRADRESLVAQIKAKADEVAARTGSAPSAASASPALQALARPAPTVPISGDDISELPPLPPPLPETTVTQTAVTAATMPVLPAPRLDIQCYTPGDLGDGAPCGNFQRGTTLIVRAGENLPSGTSLRFVRDDEPRGDVQLTAMKRGQSTRLALPNGICHGVVGAELRIEIVRSASAAPGGEQVVDTLGPYQLGC